MNKHILLFILIIVTLLFGIFIGQTILSSGEDVGITLSEGCYPLTEPTFEVVGYNVPDRNFIIKSDFSIACDRPSDLPGAVTQCIDNCVNYNEEKSKMEVCAIACLEEE